LHISSDLLDVNDRRFMFQNISQVDIARRFSEISASFSDSIAENSLMLIAEFCLDVSHLDNCIVFTFDKKLSIDVSVEATSARHTSLRSPANHRDSYFRQSLLNKYQLFTESGSISSSEFMFVLQDQDVALGGIYLNSQETAFISPLENDLLHMTSDFVAANIQQCRILIQTRQLVSQLQNALDSRVVLEQAKGVIAERMQVSTTSAFQELRNASRCSHRSIHEVATEIISSVHV